MIQGESVEVWAPEETGRDALNNPTTSWGLEAVVPNVLVAPADSADVENSIRNGGDLVVWALHFPKTYSGSLRGRRLKIRGKLYKVEGDPVAYQRELTPGSWDRPVRASLVEG